MTTTAIKVYISLSLVISCLPALAGLVARCRGYLWSGIILYLLSFLFLFFAVFLYATVALLRRGTPWLLDALFKLNRILTPLASSLARSRIVGPLVAIVIRGNFFVWFVVLLLSDQVLRALIARLVGRHGSQRNFSIVNAVDPDFTFFDPKLQENDKDASRSTKYSQSLAYTLAVASKIVYEDVGVIKHELAKDGFDVDHTFLPMAYRNVCAFIVEKDNDIYLVFRGTNPLNIQNMVTDCNIGMKEIKSSSGISMGRVHKGFWEAMGEPATVKRDDSTLHIQLNAASLYRTVSSTIQAAVTIAKFTALQLIHHVTDPVDSSWIGHDTDIRNHSLYAQAEQWIMDLVAHEGASSDSAVDLQAMTGSRKRLFITGHSLGGALATIFLAKMIQSQSPLLEYFSGLYTYGQPKIGDREFTFAFDPQISQKMFHHAYNNDIITRIPSWFNYDTPPGTLVFIDTKYDITLYPPNPQTNEPVPIRSISYVHLSGLLNAQVIRRLKHESWLRIMFRVLFPFFLNDHFPSEYCQSLRSGCIDLVVTGQKGLEGGKQDVQGDEEERFVGITATSLSPSTAATYKRYPNGSHALYN